MKYPFLQQTYLDTYCNNQNFAINSRIHLYNLIAQLLNNKAFPEPRKYNLGPNHE